jgi:signal transduction histidine kinase
MENARLFSDALAAVRARDEFLAVAAHELRTPITSALLYVQSLRRLVGRDGAATSPPVGSAGPRSPAALVESADRQVRKLSRLMDQLLDVSRIATHRLVLRLEATDWAELVHDVLAALSADLQRARCSVQLTTPERMVGRWDVTRLEQVTTNLVGNALKFGAGRPIEITLEELGWCARLSVRDHGIGISREDQSRIFERFERAVPVTHFGGMGLGLYVTGQIVRALGGAIRVESQVGEGALFVVELPWQSPPA